MPVVVVVGVQWGDEGKGKIVDYLTERAELVVRFQGGHNAGHTVVVEGRKTALRLIPSGILRPNTRCLMASGVVLDPETLFSEFESLAEIGVEVTPQRLGIAGEVQLILPYHQAIDLERERIRGDSKIGTTGKGIGPAYEDAVTRSGIRLADLFDDKALPELVRVNVEAKNLYLSSVLGSSTQFDAAQIHGNLIEVAERLRPYVANVSLEVDRAAKSNKYVMLEGAQGCLLDINHGTYPFVTSSNTVASYAGTSAGFGPRMVDAVLGICKAYTTRVGGGPFPTEDPGEHGDILRERGGEFGTVTGRPRRCGWFDVMAMKRAVRVNGITSLILTKLDVLTGFDRVRIGVEYRLDGKLIDDLPVLSSEIERVEVKYEDFEGWDKDITGVKNFVDLPETAQKFVRRIEELVECEIGGFSVGPDRSQTVITSEQILRFAA